MIPLYEAWRIAEVTGVPEEMVKRVLRYVNMTYAQREQRQKLEKDREDHDL